MANTLVDRAAKFINRYSMFPPGSKAGVAVSGGADSVALVHVLHRLALSLGLELCVLHMNHGLRGAESEADEAFVRQCAESLGLSFLGAAGVPHSAPAENASGNLEQEARELRQAFFAEARIARGFQRIALGHTRSDQAETVLHRFLRGTGLTGLAAMRPVTTGGLVRPFLEVSRDEVRAWLRSQGIPWRDDSSNSDLRFTRNSLRWETMPALTARYNSNLEAALAGTARLAQTEEDYWNSAIEELRNSLIRRHRLGFTLEVSELEGIHLAARRRLVRCLAGELRPTSLKGLDSDHIEAVLDLCGSVHGHDRVIIPGVDALRSFETLLLSPAGRIASEPRGYRFPLLEEVTLELPHGAGQICVRSLARQSGFCDTVKGVEEPGLERVRLNCEVGRNLSLWVRNWEPGDELHRAGHQQPEKVKELFQEHRVRLWERRHWPVVISEGGIAWVRTFGESRLFREGEAAARFELVYRPAPPTAL